MNVRAGTRKDSILKEMQLPELPTWMPRRGGCRMGDGDG